MIVAREGYDAIVLTRLCFEEEFFGEAAMIGLAGESAEAFGTVGVMSWPVSLLKDIILSNPQCGIGLIQILARTSMELSRRLLQFAGRSIPLRLAEALLDLASHEKRRSDVPGQVECLPHRMLARYIGTSREIVTLHLNDFRRRGLLVYTRKVMEINIPGLERMLQGEQLNRGPVEVQHVVPSFSDGQSSPFSV